MDISPINHINDLVVVVDRAVSIALFAPHATPAKKASPDCFLARDPSLLDLCGLVGLHLGACPAVVFCQFQHACAGYSDLPNLRHDLQRRFCLGHFAFGGDLLHHSHHSGLYHRCAANWRADLYFSCHFDDCLSGGDHAGGDDVFTAARQSRLVSDCQRKSR